MPVQDTSLETYYNEVKPTLGARQMAVMEAFKKREEFTNAELAQFLQWPINTVTPRTNELVALEYLVQSRKKICNVTGRMVIAWKLNPIRKKTDFKKWDGENNVCCYSFKIFGTHMSNCQRKNLPVKKDLQKQLF